MGMPSLFALHPTNAAAKPQAGRTDTEDADAAGLWASIAEAAAGDPSSAGTPLTTGTPTIGAAREEPGAADPGAAMADRAAPFDLPAFLQVLPKAGTAVAVAAGREPVMAAALRRLPAGDATDGTAAVSSRPVSAQDSVSLRIPTFLVPKADAAQNAAQAGPSTAGPTAMTGVPMDAQLGAMAVLRGAFQAITPTRQTGGSAGAPSRTAAPSVTVGEVAPGLTDAARTPAVTDAAREAKARGMETVRQPGRRAGEARAQEGIAALLANTTSANTATANTTTANALSTGATPVASALHSTALGTLTMLDPSGLTGLTSGPSAAPAEAGHADGLLDAQVGSEAWQDQLGAQLSVMATAGGETEAVMKLAPEELGELEIRVLIRDGEASVQFGAANAEARQAIEAAQPRLRELFASQGMGVSNFSVFSSLTGNPHSSSRQGEGAPRSPRGGAVVHEDMQVRVSGRDAQGIVDLYA